MDRVSRILVGIDLHGDASDVVAKGARLASAFGATLELFAPVYNSLVSRAHFPETGALERARQRLVHSGLERLKTLEAALGGTVEVECEAAWDHPAEEAVIRRAMQSRADLVVVALQPHPEHRFPFFSGADWQLARQCPVPVLLCRPGRWKARPVIVAAIDPLPHRGRKASLDIRILRAADAVGRACGGELRTFHAYEPITPVAGTSVLVELPVDRAEQALEGGHAAAVEGVMRESGLRRATVDLQEGPARDRLPVYCAEAGADLVVMGAIARNPLGRIFIGSTAERVLHRLPCDVMIVKPEGFRTAVHQEPCRGESEAGPVIGVPGI
jgi:universal stress protein E